ncbi:MAG: sugar phosphate nucleotidyltransferase [Kouleothrix sp.]
MKNAEHLLKSRFLVISGDALTDFSLAKIIAFHNESKALAALTLTRVPNPLEYGVIIVGEDGHVTQFLEAAGTVFSDTVQHRDLRARPRGVQVHPQGQDHRLVERRVSLPAAQKRRHVRLYRRRLLD